MPRSRLHVFTSCAALAAAAVSISASSAHAASSTTCTGSSAVSYSPGLTITPQTVNWTEADTYSSCTSTDTSLTAGASVPLSLTASGVSCNGGGVALPTGAMFDYTIVWTNGQSSTVTLTTSSDVIVAGTEQITDAGTVTSGEFTGAAVTIVWIYPVLNLLQCLTSPGVTSQSGTVIVQIIGA